MIKNGTKVKLISIDPDLNGKKGSIVDFDLKTNEYLILSEEDPKRNFLAAEGDFEVIEEKEEVKKPIFHEGMAVNYIGNRVGIVKKIDIAHTPEGQDIFIYFIQNRSNNQTDWIREADIQPETFLNPSMIFLNNKSADPILKFREYITDERFKAVKEQEKIEERIKSLDLALKVLMEFERK